MMQPIRNNILVKPLAYSEKSKGGIFLPFERLEANNNLEIVKAEVVAVGPGYHNSEGVFVTPRVKVGTTIGFGGRQYSGTKLIEEDGVEYRLLREEDALVVFEGDKSA